MPDHTRAFVPLETWAYNAPEVRAANRTIDIGQFAESLIYYDQIIVNVANQPQFAEFLDWFIRQDRFDLLLSLFLDGTIQVYEYSFFTAPILKEGEYSIWNITDESQKRHDSFEQRFLYHQDIENVVRDRRDRRRLYQSLRGRVIEVKADEFSQCVEDVRRELGNPGRHALVVQALVDEIYRFKDLGKSPEIECRVLSSADGTKHQITVNTDILELGRLAGATLNVSASTPLCGSALSNRFLLSASRLNCDLFPGQPMSTVVGDKLFESTRAVLKPAMIIEELKAEVEFPSIRNLVNNGRLCLDDVMRIREASKKFRSWLQQEAERDRNAIIAYHYEVAKQTGIEKFGRKAISLFGFIGGGAIGGAIGAAAAGPAGAAAGGAIGGVVSYLAEIGSKAGSEWKPIVFGNWLRDRIEKLNKLRD